MAQWLRSLPHKPDHLELNPWNLRADGKHWPMELPLIPHALECSHTHTKNTHTHTKMKSEFFS